MEITPYALFCYVVSALHLTGAVVSLFFEEWLVIEPTSSAYPRVAGLVLIGNAALVTLLVDAPIELAVRHCKFQILNWTAWCCWEAHGLIVEGAGLGRFFACFVTLFFSMYAWKYCDDKRIEEEEARASRSSSNLRGVLEGADARV